MKILLQTGLSGIILLLLLGSTFGLPAVAAADDPPPMHLDWRDIDGENFLTPVKDQAVCLAGSTFAYVGMVEAMMKIALDNPFVEPNLSEQQLYSCAGGVCLDPPPIDDVVALLMAEGLVDEACLPYENHENASCEMLCADNAQRTVRPTGLVSLDYPSPLGMTYALLEGPLIARALLHLDFLDYEGGIYQHGNSPLLGMQDLLIVGYDAEQQYWIVKGSYGADWGENGYARVSWLEPIFGAGIARVALDVEAMCAANQAPQIDSLYVEADAATQDLFFSFGFADTEANLAGGELWYRIDEEPAQRFAEPLRRLQGTDSTSEAIFGYHLSLTEPLGAHTLTISVRDLCGAASNELSGEFNVTATEPPVDDDDDAVDDDIDDDDSEAGEPNLADDDENDTVMADDEESGDDGGCGF